MKKHLQRLLLLAALLVPWVTQAQGTTYHIGDSTSTTQNYSTPVNTYFNYSVTETIIDVSELGGGIPMLLSSIKYKYAYSSPMTASNYGVKIWLKPTSKSTFASNTEFEPVDATATLVYDASFACSQGWNEFTFTTPYFYDGTSNLMVIVWDSVSGYNSSSHKYYTATSTGAKTFAAYSDSYNPDPRAAISSYSGSKSTYSYRTVMALVGAPVSLSCPYPTNLTLNSLSATSATFSWQAGGTETSWRVSDGTNSTVVTTPTYTFTGLTPVTNYTFSVRALCSSTDSSFAMTYSVTTPCAAATVPFTQGFEGATSSTSTSTNNLISCWDYINRSTRTTYAGCPTVYNGSSYAHGGSKSIRFYTYYSSADSNQYLILPNLDAATDPVNTLRLKFWMRGGSASYIARCVVGVITDASNPRTFIPVDTFDNATTTYAQYAASFATYTGANGRLALMFPKFTTSSPGSGYNQGYVDDITVEKLPACPGVERLAISRTTPTTAQVNWAANATASSWEVCYYPTATPAAADTLVVTSYPLTLTNLTAGTAYTLSVTPVCTIGDSSTETATVTFRTECAYLDTSDIPYTMGFETADGVTGTGSSTSATFAVNCWHRLNNGTQYFGYPYVYGSAYHTGSRGIYWYGSTTTTGTYGDYQVVVLPGVDTTQIPVNTLQLRFWAKATNASYHPTFIVGVMSDPEDISTFVPVDTVLVNHTQPYGIDWAEYLVSLASYTDTGCHVAIRANRPTSAWYAYMDDITLEPISDCPRVENLALSRPTPTSVTLSWTEAGTATSYTVRYFRTSTPASADTLTVTDTIVRLDSLTAGTAYTVQVSPVCSGSTVAHELRFTTECAYGTVPFVYGFEGASTGGATSTTWVNCWHRLNNGTTNFGYPYVSSTADYCHTGTRGLYWYNTTTTGTYGDYQVVVLPGIDTVNYAMNLLQLKFWAKATTATYHPEFQVGIMSDPEDLSTFQLVGTVNVNPEGNTDWDEYAVAFTDFAGVGNHIAIRADRPTTSWYACVDDITVDMAPQCPPITHLTVEQTATTGAFITWDYQTGLLGTPSEFEIKYYVAGDTTTTVTSTVDSGYVFLTGLDTNTSYVFCLRANCGGYGYGEWDSISFTTNSLGCWYDPAQTHAYTSGTATTQTTGVPVYNNWGNTLCQSIYLASELVAAGFPTTGADITDLTFTWTANASFAKYFTIYMTNTTQATYASAAATNWVATGAAAKVYEGDHPLNTTGTVTYHLTTPFHWDGTSNICVTTTMNQPAGISQTNSGFYGYSTVTSPSATRTMYKYQDSDPLDGSNPSSISPSSTSTYRTNITFTSQTCAGVATCTEPTVVAASVGATEITIQWAPGFQETAWDVEYRRQGAPTWSMLSMAETNNSYTVTNLAPGTQYEFRVSHVCDSVVYSATTSAVTSCAVIAHSMLPYRYGFEDLTSTGSGSAINRCWGRGYQSGTTYNANSYPYAYATTPHDGDRSLYFYGNGTTIRSWLCFPVFEDSINTLQVDFWARKTNTSYSGQIKLGVMTDPTDYTTFQLARTVTTDNTTDWNRFEIPLDSAAGTGYITFMVEAGSTTSNYLCIDDITVEPIPTCLHVQNMQVDSLGTSWAGISWTEVGNASSWYIEYDTVDFIPGTNTAMNTETAYDTAIVLNFLDTATTYYLYLRADCGAGDTSTYESMTFTTLLADPATVPYSCTFEGSRTEGWEFANGTQTNYWMVGNATNNGGNRAMYITNDGTANAYTNTVTSNVYAVRTFNLSDSGEYAYSFDWKCQGESRNYDYLRVFLAPGTAEFTGGSYIIGATSVSGFATAEAPAGWIDLSGFTASPYTLVQSSTWQTNEGTFRLTTPGMYKLVFVWSNDGSGGSNPPAAVDNITLVRNTCPKPTDFHASYVSADTIILSWLPGGSETQWVLSDGNTEMDMYDTTYIFDNLLPNTAYTFYLRGVCDYDDTSAISTLTVRTACSTMQLPYYEDFESHTTSTTAATGYVMPCWDYVFISSSTGDSYRPQIYYAATTGTYVYAGNYALRLYYKTCTALPRLSDEDTSVSMSFWARHSSATYTLEVGVMTDPQNAATFVPVDTINYAGTTFELHEVNFSGHLNDSVHYIAFRNTHTSYEYSYHYIDNISVWRNSSCATPSRVSVSNVTNRTATVEWSDTSNTYMSTTILWGTINNMAAAIDSASVPAGTNSYTINGLNAVTTYYVWVRGDCSDEPSRPVSTSFTTTVNCVPVSNLHVVATDYHAFGLAWDAPNGGEEPTEYIVRWKAADSTVWDSTTTTDLHIHITGLDTNTAYQYNVTTICDQYVSNGVSGTVNTLGCGFMVTEGGSSFESIPAEPYYMYSYTQQIYLDNELTGIDTISSIAFHAEDAVSTRSWVVYMGNTTRSSFNGTSDYVPLTSMTQVASATVSGTGWITVNLTTPFIRTTGSNLVIAVDDNTGSYESQVEWTGTATSSARTLYFYQDDDDILPANPSAEYSDAVNYVNQILVRTPNCQVPACNTPVVFIDSVDANNAYISWTAEAGQTYTVSVLREDQTVWTLVDSANTTGVAQATGLSAGMNYTAKVTVDCNGTSLAGTTTFATECGAMDVPYTEDFQSSSYGIYSRLCWTVGSVQLGTSYPYPYVISLQGATEDKLCLIYNGGYLILPKMNVPLNQLQIRFKLTQGGEGVRLLFGIMDDPQDPINTMRVLDTLVRSDIDTLVSTVTITYPFDQLTDTTGYLAFWDAFNDNYSFLNDIVVEYIPNCIAVSGVTASNVTTNTATLSWADSSAQSTSYVIEYGPRGFTPGTGTTVSTTSLTETLYGLNHSTNYEAYIYTVCAMVGDNDTSIASPVVQFTTDCDVVTTLPYYTDFENIMSPGSSATNVLPNCWASEGTGVQPHIAWYSSSLYAPSTSHSFVFAADGVAALPEMSTPIDSLMVTFYDYNANPSTYGLVIGVVDSITAGFSASFVPVDTITFTPGVNQYTNVISYLSGYTGNGGRIAIKSYGNSSTNVAHYIDNLTVKPIPSCVMPFRIHTTALTNVSADLAWSVSQASIYHVEYGVHGFTPGTGMTTTTTTDSVSLTGLNPMTQYDVRIVGICGANDTSDTAVFTFTTLRAVPVTTYPYICNFADSAMAMAWEPINGTQANKWCVGNATGYGTADTAALYISNDNGTSNAYNISSTSHTYASRTFTMVPGSYTISYKWRAYGESTWDFLRAFLAPASATVTPGYCPDGVTTSANTYGVQVPTGWFCLDGEAPARLNQQSTWQSVSLDVNITTGGDYKMLFYWGNDGSGGTQPPAAIDEIEVYHNTCPAVQNVIAYTFADSIALTWTPGGTEQEWIVTCGTTSDTVHTPSHTLTGLTSSTNYTVSIVGVCDSGDTSRVATNVFRTPCQAVTLPYQEDFDTLTTTHPTSSLTVRPSCWEYVMTGTATYQGATYLPGVYYSTTYPSSGEFCYRLYGVGYHMLPPMPTSLDSLQLTFSQYVTSTTSGLQVGVMEGNTFVPVETITPTASQHMNYTVYFGAYTGRSRIIAFRNYYTTSTTTYYTTNYLDDIVVSYLPNCAPVVAITSTGATSSSLTVDWTDQSQATAWEIEYGLAGYTFGSATAGTRITVNAHPATITGLDTLTSYDVYVRPICSATDTGDWTTAPATFQTSMCETPEIVSIGSENSTTTSNAYPVNNFYNYTLSETIIDSAELNDIQDISYIAYYYNYATATTSKTNCTIYFQPTTKTTFSDNTDVVALNPATAVKVYEGDLNCSEGWNYFALDTTYSYTGSGNLLVIVDDNSYDYDGSTSVFKTAACTGNKTLSYYSDSYDPDVTSPSSYSGTKNVYAYRTVMKLVSCGAPACRQPILVSDTGDYQSHTITWRGTGNTYQVACKTTDATAWPAETSVTGTSYTFTGLQPSTVYMFRVRQDCTADSLGYSDWTTGSFVTDNLPCLAPDSLTVSNITNTNATFGWTARGTETAWDIRVRNSAFDTVYRTLTTNPATVSGLTAGVTYYASIRALCGNAQNIEGEWSDSIQFSTLVCPNVTGLATGNVTFNSVTLTWDTAANAQSYEVEYGQTGFTQGNGTRLTATTNTLTVNGLMDETSYQFYVRAVCGTNWNSENWSTPVTVTTLTAPSTTYNITASVTPTNAGSVLGTGTYAEGDTAVLTATANTGYTFTRWNDNVTANPRSVVVTSDSAFTAFFTLNQYTVTVLSADSSRGTVTGGGSYNHGDVATLTATAATGYHFTQWNDGDTHAVRTVTVTSDTTFTASFGVNSYNVTVTANDNTMGTVTGGGQYNFRDTVTLTATANTGYYFQRWNDGNVDNPRVIVVTGDVSLTAIFASDSVPPVQTYTVTLTANDANMGIVSGAGTYTEGTSVLISATPNAGYRFVNWNDGVTDNPRTFVLTCDTAFTANFAELVDSTAVLVVTFDSEMGYVLINGNEAGTYNGLLGDEVSLEARANEGYRFVEWSDGETSATRTITLEQSRTTLTATFAVGSNGIATVEDNVNCLIYPNPASSSTTISVSGVNGKVRIAVIDINGRVAASETMECAGDCVKTMNVDNLSQGAYFVRITGEKVNMVKKLIVR